MELTDSDLIAQFDFYSGISPYCMLHPIWSALALVVKYQNRELVSSDVLGVPETLPPHPVWRSGKSVVLRAQLACSQKARKSIPVFSVMGPVNGFNALCVTGVLHNLGFNTALGWIRSCDARDGMSIAELNKPLSNDQGFNAPKNWRVVSL